MAVALIGHIACSMSLSGCAAALPVIAVVGVTGAVASVVAVVNMARDQYPDVDFDKPAPVETIYHSGMDETWNAVVDTLMEMKESTAMMDKSSGIIRTSKKNLNDVSWIGKGLGKATFLYEYNITVRPKSGGASVQLMVNFCEEKMFIASKEKNIPEGSNMMRHIFYRNLNQRIKAASVRLPDSPMQDIRHSPMSEGSQSHDQFSNQVGLENLKVHAVDIAKAQQLLNDKGYAAGKPDGKIGPKTRQAIAQFQKDMNIPVTGRLNAETMEKLGK